jgi:hypothetical protein
MPQNLTPPKKGAMYLFDYITPPLRPDLYRLEVSTEVAYDDETPKLEDEKYFEVVGPRFSLPPTDIAGVFPPRNGRGPYEGSLAQVVIRRRTLPWEREMDKNKLIGNTTLSDPLPASYPVPWMALLLFEETEFELLENVPLENVVPKSVFERLGSPANILCNAVEADSQLVRDIMPSKEELQLLAHVRWVNTDDRELNVEGSDGWFAVVMTNRLPRAGTKCRACLVSLEERTDLVKADPPKTYLPQQGSDLDVLDPGLSMVRDFHLYKTKGVDRHRVVEQRSDTLQGKLTSVITRTRLVLLHSWQFTCEGAGTFYGLMQGLDVGLIGKTKKAGQPALTDTGHIHLKLQDRSGVEETVWYRGPLVPFELTRDPLGPYHSADQARRASPETGAEDISYAAAFEVGRLLAARDVPAVGACARDLRARRFAGDEFAAARRGQDSSRVAAFVGTVEHRAVGRGRGSHRGPLRHQRGEQIHRHAAENGRSSVELEQRGGSAGVVGRGRRYVGDRNGLAEFNRPRRHQHRRRARRHGLVAATQEPARPHYGER